jgi:hypothetical protein
MDITTFNAPHVAFRFAKEDASMNHEYKIAFGYWVTTVKDGIALDACIKDLVARGVPLNEIQITIVTVK